MDDLQQAVARNLSVREAEADEARALVREEVERFARWLSRARRGADDLGAAPPRRRDRRAGAARERVALGVAQRRRPRAARGDGARRRQPAPARADAAAQGLRRRGRVLPLRRTRCTSCSASRPRWRRTTRRPRRSPPLDAAPPQPRAVTSGWGRAAARSRSPRPGWVAERLEGDVELVPIRTSGDERRGGAPRPRTSRASSRRSRRRCSPARSTSPSTPRRTCPASCPTASRSSACPSAPTRATRSAAPPRSTSWPRAPSWARRASAAAPRCSPCGRISHPRAARERGHPAAPARGGRLRRDRARLRRASPGSAARRAACRSRDAGPGRRARAASRSRRARTTRPSPRRPPPSPTRRPSPP